jgi:purine-binding chemotaxis protein CheW
MAEETILMEPFILFELAGTTYGVRSRQVRQIEMVEHITPVPDAPPFIDGVVFARGQVIPALSLRARFGFERVAGDLRTRLIVIGASQRTVGLIVDTAREFLSIPADAVKPPPDEISGLSGHYLEGIASLGNRLVLILDVDEVLKLSGVEHLDLTASKEELAGEATQVEHDQAVMHQEKEGTAHGLLENISE